MVESTVSVALISVFPPAVKVMVVVLRTAWRFAGAVMESVTVPVKPFRACTLTRQVPVKDGKKSNAAVCHAVTRGPMEPRWQFTLKSGFIVTVIVAEGLVLPLCCASPP
jgi:hypothetical protein